MVESGVVEGCGDLGAEAGFAFRNDGVPEAFDVDAVVQEGVAHIHGDGRFAEHDRDDGMAAFEDFKTELLDVFPEVCGVRMKMFDEAAVLVEDAERLGCGDRDCRRKGIGENVGPGFLADVLDDIFFPGDVTAGGPAHRLA